MKFEELLTNEDLLDALYDMRFDEPTPIQLRAIPAVIEGKDVLGIAQTGTGKTAAYLLPIIQRLIDDNYPQDVINVLIMVPTRELALQIDKQLQGFSYYLPVSGTSIYGGTDGDIYQQQRKALKTGTDIVVATPGRMLQHISMGNVDLSKVSFFVLDEADRMLDMGFFDDIMQIVKKLPSERQNLLFSATMPKEIRKLASTLLTSPHEIRLAPSRPAAGVSHYVWHVDEKEKKGKLKDFLRQNPPERVIIFAASKNSVRELAGEISRSGFKAAEMHSDLDQKVREEVMLKFRAGKINIVVATDIISRGIDIDDIETVINYDVPAEAEDYIHRVGRTARAKKTGMALTFVSRKETGKLKAIERLLKKPIELLPGTSVSELKENKPSNSGKRYTQGNKKWKKLSKKDSSRQKGS